MAIKLTNQELARMAENSSRVYDPEEVAEKGLEVTPLYKDDKLVGYVVYDDKINTSYMCRPPEGGVPEMPQQEKKKAPEQNAFRVMMGMIEEINDVGPSQEKKAGMWIAIVLAMVGVVIGLVWACG